MNINDAIKIAIVNVKDPFAQTYLRAMPKAIEYGLDGLSTQLCYALSNMKTWRGETARSVKIVMRKFIKTTNSNILTAQRHTDLIK